MTTIINAMLIITMIINVKLIGFKDLYRKKDILKANYLFLSLKQPLYN